ncbi:MAG: hypothetical protein MPW14_26215 (plasmid) [Candidatus Manganitrophus sp.]|nr:MAG: hypothetical protein MPW14_26215 [Candidatus Manganitrophus sp.]
MSRAGWRRSRVGVQAQQVGVDQHAVLVVGQAGAGLRQAVARDIRDRLVADAVCVGVVHDRPVLPGIAERR